MNFTGKQMFLSLSLSLTTFVVLVVLAQCANDYVTFFVVLCLSHTGSRLKKQKWIIQGNCDDSMSSMQTTELEGTVVQVKYYKYSWDHMFCIVPS